MISAISAADFAFKMRSFTILLDDMEASSASNLSWVAGSLNGVKIKKISFTGPPQSGPKLMPFLDMPIATIEVSNVGTLA